MKPATYTINGTEITVYPTTLDTYGNPRFIVHFLAFPNLNPDPQNRANGIDQIMVTQDKHIDNVRRAIGGKRYRGKNFGGGIVFTSYNVEETLRHALQQTV